MDLEHAPGRAVDVLGEGPTVLMWHGGSTDIRSSMGPLAAEVAERGRRVVVPDWDPLAADRGSTDVFTSLRFARETADHDPDELTILGWSMGGIAAASLCLNQRRLGIGFARVVLVAAAPFPRVDPISGERIGPATPPVERSTSVAFVNATHDQIIDLDDARATHDQWADVGWSTTFTEIDADHFTIVHDHARALADLVVA